MATSKFIEKIEQLINIIDETVVEKTLPLEPVRKIWPFLLDYKTEDTYLQPQIFILRGRRRKVGFYLPDDEKEDNLAFLTYFENLCLFNFEYQDNVKIILTRVVDNYDDSIEDYLNFLYPLKRIIKTQYYENILFIEITLPDTISFATLFDFVEEIDRTISFIWGNNALHEL